MLALKLKALSLSSPLSYLLLGFFTNVYWSSSKYDEGMEEILSSTLICLKKRLMRNKEDYV